MIGGSKIPKPMLVNQCRNRELCFQAGCVPKCSVTLKIEGFVNSSRQQSSLRLSRPQAHLHAGLHDSGWTAITMTLSNTGSVLATLTQLTQLNRTSVLTHRVKDLSVPEFICLLDFITAEFQQFLRAIEMINNEALETMLEQVMDAFTLKIG